ncbi:MAG TPA: prepilin-type N-terminal cleavage/methylation domain-containing protein [Candidatus Didemnitutus sp.]|nr:prepilin-type N-terminal cleavage/methylation domain-containing protein [Candidatus Didemnitutus sp.]
MRTSRRGYTLVELMIGLTLGSMLMLAVLTTYLFLGRGSTRLAYQHLLEVEARTLMNTVATDVQATRSITSASSTGLALKLVDGSTVTYTYSGGILSRDPGTGAVALVTNISGEAVTVPVTLTNFSFSYLTTTDGDPTYQATTTIIPLSIKQVAVTMTFRAGSTAQMKSGTQTSYPAASGWLLFRNKQLPDGN